MLCFKTYKNTAVCNFCVVKKPVILIKGSTNTFKKFSFELLQNHIDTTSYNGFNFKEGRKIPEGQSNSQIKNKLTTPWLKIWGKTDKQ